MELTDVLEIDVGHHEAANRELLAIKSQDVCREWLLLAFVEFPTAKVVHVDDIWLFTARHRLLEIGDALFQGQGI